MMLPVDNDAQVVALLKRLSAVSGEFAAQGVLNPTFVLLTQNLMERQKVENRLCAYLANKYNMNTLLGLDHSSPTFSRFRFPEVPNCCVILVDIASPKQKQ